MTPKRGVQFRDVKYNGIVIGKRAEASLACCVLVCTMSGLRGVFLRVSPGKMNMGARSIILWLGGAASVMRVRRCHNQAKRNQE